MVPNRHSKELDPSIDEVRRYWNSHVNPTQFLDCMIVECRRKGPQLVPVRFGPTGGEQDVAEVLNRWSGEDHLNFKFRTPEDDIYILR